PFKEFDHFQAHWDPVSTLAFSPNGVMLATGSEDDTIRLWGLIDLSRQFAYVGLHEGPVHCLAYSPNGNTLASCSGKERMARLWPAMLVKDDIIRGFDETVTCLAFTSNSKLLATGGGKQRVEICGVADGQPLTRTRLPDIGASVASIAFAHDDKI